MLATRANLPEVLRHFFTQKWPLYRPFACLFICLLLDIKTYDGKNYFGLSLRERPFNSEWWGLENVVGSEYLFSTFNCPDRK
jgi:hypothetical protein